MQMAAWPVHCFMLKYDRHIYIFCPSSRCVKIFLHVLQYSNFEYCEEWFFRQVTAVSQEPCVYRDCVRAQDPLTV